MNGWKGVGQNKYSAEIKASGRLHVVVENTSVYLLNVMYVFDSIGEVKVFLNRMRFTDNQVRYVN